MRRRLATWLLARPAGVPFVASVPREAGATGLSEDLQEHRHAGTRRPVPADPGDQHDRRSKAPLTETARQVTPGYHLFDDWQGMFRCQPNERFVRDPWRLIADLSAIDGRVFRKQIGLACDHANVRLQLEYVL